MTTHAITLHNAQQAHTTIASLWAWAKPRLLQGRKLHLSIRDATRSTEQNALLHATLAEIAATLEWAGAKRDVETWKRLFTAAWLRARGEHVEMLPALDGCGVDIVFRRTSSLTVAECGELLDYIGAWRAAQ